MTLEIYYNDLTPEAQKRYLEFFKLDSAADGNLDMPIFPIFELDSAEWDDEWERACREGTKGGYAVDPDEE